VTGESKNPDYFEPEGLESLMGTLFFDLSTHVTVTAALPSLEHGRRLIREEVAIAGGP
jgi:hypothetical protein